jgi:tetratricopeptide (TPR) repeat protein
MTQRLTSLVLAVQVAAFLGMRVHAQQVGDTVVVATAAGAKVRIGDREVGSASRGAHLIVREVRGGLLRVFCDGGYGWVKRNEVIPLDEGIDFFSAALRAKPSADDYVSRGRLWRAKGNVDKAIADYNEALRLDPKNQFAYNVRGNAWRDKGDFEKAQRTLTKQSDLSRTIQPHTPTVEISGIIAANTTRQSKTSPTRFG